MQRTVSACDLNVSTRRTCGALHACEATCEKDDNHMMDNILPAIQKP